METEFGVCFLVKGAYQKHSNDTFLSYLFVRDVVYSSYFGI